MLACRQILPTGDFPRDTLVAEQRLPILPDMLGVHADCDFAAWRIEGGFDGGVQNTQMQSV